MLKKDLRVKYKSLRKELTYSDIDAKSIAILKQIENNIDISNKIVSLFLPIKKHKEVNTYFLLNYLKEKNVQITVPKSNFKTIDLSHILIDKDTKIEESSFGIPEPLDGLAVTVNSIDIVFIPFLAVNKKGYRVGYGKGFYDRFLSQCKDNCLFIGLHLFESFDEIDDIHKGDIPLHLVITPTQVKQF